ncbi:YnfA family protein [Uliginosibacterium sp. 31-16]|uniref:YnfA family protein n=1 Tax=Uliginosibacterium sp. 31-16 TaxID=3068315 RepID=UPI00273E097E|nr:YnfA family protein [Uliginosibacterium sp. 31-16]MDP5239468.1 YnfA family protein [Uliginosibacterium sp. 31-16]
MTTLQTFALYALTAVAEIFGCYLPYLWLKKSVSAWWLFPAAACLALFAWLLTLHPHPAGRVYAAYGGVYVVVSLIWLWRVDGIVPDRWDLAGCALVLVGAGLIYFAPRAS